MAPDQTIVYGKLVRDRIPEIITATGQTPTYRVLDSHEQLPALIAKLHEEADELADVHEVLAALTSVLGFTSAQVEAAATRKRAARGAFARHLWLDEVSP